MATQTSKGKTVNIAAKVEPVKKSKTTHLKGKDAPTACSCWNPKVSITPNPELVTCKTCLASLNPKATKKHEKKPDVTIKCADCKAERVVPASQAKTVTRCLACQKKAIKAKRKAKAKVRKARKESGSREAARVLLEGLKGETSKDLRALASLIYKTTKK